MKNMQAILLGFCFLFFIAGAAGRRPHHPGWTICHYQEGGYLRRIHCDECCGPWGDQHCCGYYDSTDSEDSEDHDVHNDNDHHHNVKVVVVMGSLAIVVFTIVLVGCCVFHMKYKKQQSQTETVFFSDAVIDHSMPSMQQVSTKSPLPDDHLYTGQNQANNDKTNNIAVIGTMLSSPPPYHTKY